VLSEDAPASASSAPPASEVEIEIAPPPLVASDGRSGADAPAGQPPAALVDPGASHPSPPPAPVRAQSAAPAVAAASVMPNPPPPRRESARPSSRASAPALRGPRSVPPRPVAVGPTGTASLAGPLTEAGFAPRLVAGVIDFAIVASVQALLMVPVAQHWWARELPASPADVPFLPIFLSLAMIPVALILGGVYYAVLWGLKGATPGKRVVGLTVVADDGAAPIGMSRATLRVLGYVASGLLLGVGFLMIAFGGTALHDRIAGTRVVRRGTVG
jgi:uncharacterized RDD family membrane protein YckC